MSFILSSLLFSVAMSADRVFALGWPMTYKRIDYKRHQAFAAVICFLLPIPLSFSLAFYWSWRPAGDHYVGYSDTAYLKQAYPQWALRLIVILRGVCLVVLVSLNGAIVVMFRR